MSKVYAVVRTIGEISLDDCIGALKVHNIPYEIVEGLSLQNAVKKILRIGYEKQEEYDWIMVVDADIIVTASKEEIEKHCEKMSENKDLFVFTGWLLGTKIGYRDGMHFYRTKYCDEIFNKIKYLDFSFHKGREESEICNYVVNNTKYKFEVSDKKLCFGVHLRYVNEKI